MRIIALILLLFSMNSFANCNSTHHVFLIHGIAGDATTFGSLEEIIENRIPCTKTYSFEYATGDSTKETIDFAQDLKGYITDKVTPLSNDDKISLIMHSQGGLVGQQLLSDLASTDNVLTKNLDAFITLGTPYWGAEIATIGHSTFFSLLTKEHNPISMFGKKELIQMQYGSRNIHKFLSLFNQNFNLENIRPLALGGYSLRHNSILGEDDNVVPVYSSNPNHIHINYNKGEIVEKVSLPHFVVPALHVEMDRPGIAKFDRTCTMGCDHPSLPFIINHLENQALPEIEKVSVTRLRVNFYIKMPKSVLAHSLELKPEDTKQVRFNKIIIDKEFKLVDNSHSEFDLYSASINGISNTQEIESISAKLIVNGEEVDIQAISVKAGLHTFFEADFSKEN